jgi:hypothetical protein
MEIANKREDGVQTNEILKEMRKKEMRSNPDYRKKMLEGQLNAQFHFRNKK